MYDELVAALRRQCDEMDCGNCNTCVKTQAADAIEELSREKESLAKTVQEASEILRKRWISVTERLPGTMKDKSAYSGWSAEIAPSDDVLCYLGSEKRQTVAWYSHTYEEWTTVDENTVYKYGEVTHWMPLQPAPKEG